MLVDKVDELLAALPEQRVGVDRLLRALAPLVVLVVRVAVGVAVTLLERVSSTAIAVAAVRL